MSKLLGCIVEYASGWACKIALNGFGVVVRFSSLAFPALVCRGRVKSVNVKKIGAKCKTLGTMRTEPSNRVLLLRGMDTDALFTNKVNNWCGETFVSTYSNLAVLQNMLRTWKLVRSLWMDSESSYGFQVWFFPDLVCCKRVKNVDVKKRTRIRRIWSASSWQKSLPLTEVRTDWKRILSNSSTAASRKERLSLVRGRLNCSRTAEKIERSNLSIEPETVLLGWQQANDFPWVRTFVNRHWEGSSITGLNTWMIACASKWSFGLLLGWWA